MPLPRGYSGTVLQDTKEGRMGETEDRRWVQKRSFSTLTYWSHDDAPAKSDPLFKCMRFAELAEVLHRNHLPEVEDQALPNAFYSKDAENADGNAGAS